MKLAVLLLGWIASAQVVPPVSLPSNVSQVSLPTYIAGGGAYNQLAGANLWASAIVPVLNNAGVYESTTIDMFPVKTTVNGRQVYIFTTSIREGFHKLLGNSSPTSKNAFTIGADGGYSFTQATSGVSTFGASASVTITYIRQITKSLSMIFPIRALYMPTLGGWNPILEFGFAWKP